MKLAYFPELLPDELLFSGIAALRHYHEEAHATFIKTATGIRGSTQSFLGLPTNLTSFVECLPVCSSLTVERIKREHTLTPVIYPFLRRRSQQNLEEAINGTIEAARIDCLHENLVHADKLLRYCPTCWHEDRKTHGRPFWHRCHQIKQVTACHQHGCQLIAAPVSWLTPSLRASFISAGEIVPETISTPARAEAIGFATQVHDLLTLEAKTNANTLRHAARELLRRRGMVHNDGGINWKLLQTAVAEACDTETQTTHDSDSRNLNRDWLPLSAQSSRAWLKPHQYFVLTKTLGYGLKDLVVLAGSHHWENGPWECKNPDAPCHGMLTIKSFGLSPAGDAHFTCPTCRGSYRRALPLEREPDGSFKYEITADSKGWRAKLPALWHDLTLSLEDIADRLGKHPLEIRANAAALRLGNRRQCRRAGLLDGKAPVETGTLMARRSSWLKVVAENPGRSKTDLVKANPSLGEWLYRNDTTWFSENSPAFTKRKRQSTVNHHERDSRFAGLVPKIAADILEQDPPVPLSMNGILGRLKIPLSKARLQELYPQTAEAIETEIAKQPEFINRALKAITRIWEDRDRVPTWYEFIATRALFARRCTRDGDFRQRVLDYYQSTWPENPHYIAGRLKRTHRRSVSLRQLSPEERLNNCIYPFGQLAECASFFVPLDGRDSEAIRNTVVRSMHYYKSQRLLPSGFRLSVSDAIENGAGGLRFTRRHHLGRTTLPITLDSSVPKPELKPLLRLPLEQMAVGDSFFLPHEGKKPSSTAAFVRSVVRQLKAENRLTGDFTVISREERIGAVKGLRVWRIKGSLTSSLPLEKDVPLPLSAS